MSELATVTAQFVANFEAFQRAITERLLPALEDVAREVRRWYNSWPGMPYTAPSRWAADQMKADR